MFRLAHPSVGILRVPHWLHTSTNTSISLSSTFSHSILQLPSVSAGCVVAFSCGLFSCYSNIALSVFLPYCVLWPKGARWAYSVYRSWMGMRGRHFDWCHLLSPRSTLTPNWRVGGSLPRCAHSSCKCTRILTTFALCLSGKKFVWHIDGQSHNLSASLVLIGIAVIFCYYQSDTCAQSFIPGILDILYIWDVFGSSGWAISWSNIRPLPNSLPRGAHSS